MEAFVRPGWGVLDIKFFGVKCFVNEEAGRGKRAQAMMGYCTTT